MINADIIAEAAVIEGVQWTSKTLRQSYDIMTEHWSSLDLEPNRLAASAPGVGKKYGTFHGKHRYLQKQKFDEVGSIELVRLASGGKDETAEWEVSATFIRRSKRMILAYVPALVGDRSRSLNALFSEIASICGGNCGCRFRQRMELGPIWFASGMNFGDKGRERPREYSMNISWWRNALEDGAPLLRDLYPYNYLSDAYLSAPVGRTGLNLRQWIEADPKARGQLAPFTESLAEWSPPIENIPTIREELYRAGRVFYWRFFNPSNRRTGAPSVLVTGLADTSWDEPEPLCRVGKFHEPWEAPEPIPEIYRAEYYKDKDPGLVY